MELPINQIFCGDCIEVMRGFPVESIDMVMFSPPYWGLRDYGEDTETVWGGNSNCEHEWGEGIQPRGYKSGKHGPSSVIGAKGAQHHVRESNFTSFCVHCGAWRGQLGLEPHPQMFIDHMVEVCRAVKRVLKKTGSMYVNLGDTYFGGGAHHGTKSMGKHATPKVIKEFETTEKMIGFDQKDWRGLSDYAWLQPKQKLLIPSRIAIALQEDGWILRNDIIWHKPNHMPESMKDRLTRSYEHIFHFVKARKYWYDLDAIRERPVEYEVKRRLRERREGLITHFKDQKMDKLLNPPSKKSGLRTNVKKDTYFFKGKNPGDVIKIKHDLAVGRIGDFSYSDPLHVKEYHPRGKNPGDFWKISTKPFKEAHFAVYPEKLCIKPIKSSCPPDGIVLDPMCGSGTTLVVAQRLGRKWIGIDINPNYVEMAKKRVIRESKKLGEWF